MYAQDSMHEPYMDIEIQYKNIGSETSLLIYEWYTLEADIFLCVFFLS